MLESTKKIRNWLLFLALVSITSPPHFKDGAGTLVLSILSQFECSIILVSLYSYNGKFSLVFWPSPGTACQPSCGQWEVVETQIYLVGVRWILGKDKRVRGNSLLMKALLKWVGPIWKGRQVRPGGIQRMEKECVCACACVCVHCFKYLDSMVSVFVFYNPTCQFYYIDNFYNFSTLKISVNCPMQPWSTKLGLSVECYPILFFDNWEIFWTLRFHSFSF